MPKYKYIKEYNEIKGKMKIKIIHAIKWGNIMQFGYNHYEKQSFAYLFSVN